MITLVGFLVVVSSHVRPIRVHVVELDTTDLTLVLDLVTVVLVLQMDVQTLLAVAGEGTLIAEELLAANVYCTHTRIRYSTVITAVTHLSASR